MPKDITYALKIHCNNNDEFLNNRIKCKNCIKEICCCITIHPNTLRKKSLNLSPNLSLKSKSTLFFNITKNLLPVALGIEILCIMAAEKEKILDFIHLVSI